MASLNFEETVLLILFAQANSASDVSREQLVQFEADLQKTFGAKLLKIMGEEGVQPDGHNRSAGLGCRPHMAAGTADTQIRNACRYLLKAQQELGQHAIAAFAASAGIAVGAAAGAPRAAALKPAAGAGKTKRRRVKRARTSPRP